MRAKTWFQGFGAIGIGIAVFLSQATAARAARLLFCSGFEGEVSLAAPGGGWQDVVGRDSATGATWPAELWGGRTSIQVLTGGGAPDGVIRNSIESITGHNGRQTRALHLRVMRKVKEVTQTPLVILPAREPGDFYISEWVRLPADLGRLLGPGGWLAAHPAWKTAGDFRVGVAVEVDGRGRPYWVMKWDTNANGDVPLQTFWAESNLRVPVPQNQWFRIEFFTHRSDTNGRVWLKVNGQTVFDHTGDNIGVNNAPINRIFLASAYGNAAFGVYVDDIQVWDGVPAGDEAGRPCRASPPGTQMGGGLSSTLAIQAEWQSA